MQLQTGVNLRRGTPRFLEHAPREEWMAWVNVFTTATDAIVTAVDVEEILHSDG